MGAVARQQYLQFGPEEHYELLHGRHNAQVCVAHKGAGRPFNHRVVDHELALLRASALIDDPAQDDYWSQSGVKGRRVAECFVTDNDTLRLSPSGREPAQLPDGFGHGLLPTSVDVASVCATDSGLGTACWRSAWYHL